MDDLISRKVVLKNIVEYMVNPENATGEHPDDIHNYNKGLLTAIEAVNETPSVQTTQKKGKWIESGIHSIVRCSQCNASSLWKSPCCPYCGIKMEEE